MTEIGADDLLQQALEFKKWAASEGLLAITPPREDIAQLDEEEFEAAIEGAGHDPAVAKEIFRYANMALPRVSPSAPSSAESLVMKPFSTSSVSFTALYISPTS